MEAPATMAIFGLEKMSPSRDTCESFNMLWIWMPSQCSGSGGHSKRWPVWFVKVDVGKAQDLQANPWFMGRSILHPTAPDFVIWISPPNPAPETWPSAETVVFIFWADKWWWFLLLQLWHFLSKKMILFGGGAGEGQLMTFSLALPWLWGTVEIFLFLAAPLPPRRKV